MPTEKASKFKLENEDIRSVPISKEHITSTNAKTKIECEICHETFKNNKLLRNHMKTVHYEVKYHKCNLCDMTFGNIYNLKNHVKLVHDSKKVFQCEYCGKRFAQKYKVQRHIQLIHVNTKENEQKCDICDKTFVSDKYRVTQIEIFYYKLL